MMLYRIRGIDEDKCNGCEKCVQICHHNCFEMVESAGKVVAKFTKPKDCDSCGDCLYVCPIKTSAIILEPLTKRRNDFVHEIKSDKCTACEKCISLCPSKNIEIVEEKGKVFAKIIDPKKCLADGHCTFCCDVDTKVYTSTNC